jgi:hypothetical protein
MYQRMQDDRPGQPSPGYCPGGWLTPGKRFEADVRGEVKMQRDGFVASMLHSLQYIPELLSHS